MRRPDDATPLVTSWWRCLDEAMHLSLWLNRFELVKVQKGKRSGRSMVIVAPSVIAQDATGLWFANQVRSATMSTEDTSSVPRPLATPLAPPRGPWWAVGGQRHAAGGS